MPADILIYAVIAAGLVFWLRNVLGTRHGDERERPNPFTADPAAEKKDNKTDRPRPDRSNVVPLKGEIMVGAPENLQDGLDNNMAVTGSQSEDGLRAIMQADRLFDLPHFLRGAQDAFVMIVEAFAQGQHDTLKNLLSGSVYKAFEGAIAAREKAGQTADTEIHAIRKAEVVDAALQGNTAMVTIRFVADETNILRDKDGEIISGNPERVTETIDIWTFARDIKDRDPTWRVMQTRDEDAAGDDHKTVPDHE